ncbi:DUF924 domain-containing protein [Loktanella sp. IMCC34160]|uniref:DUF924 family protein n=1 Tax=Loktanella sp. IMCC34160 TaxID=2510646 RepID=UPI00101C2EB6|nr:DUF924 family protein [Loktanella sp. IMCC34160]RYG93193.1 DUF924 domain-containing protein [Loktanella sp. IMCC34160]
MVTPEDILRYWLDDVGPRGWYGGGADLDTEIREKFQETWLEAMEGACGLWLTYPAGTLAYIILTDQFPRNMFRDQGRAFASDKSARAASKIAITRDWDLKIKEPARSFFYLPLVHSENLIDQDRAVRLICTRMPDTGDGNLLHAKAHREVIRQFGRFPNRNAALGRPSTAPEQAYLDAGGYMTTVQMIEARETAA